MTGVINYQILIEFRWRAQTNMEKGGEVGKKEATGPKSNKKLREVTIKSSMEAGRTCWEPWQSFKKNHVGKKPRKTKYNRKKKYLPRGNGRQGKHGASFDLRDALRPRFVWGKSEQDNQHGDKPKGETARTPQTHKPRFLQGEVWKNSELVGSEKEGRRGGGGKEKKHIVRVCTYFHPKKGEKKTKRN